MTLTKQLKNFFWSDDYSFHGKIFNILAVAGSVISLITALASFASDSTFAELLLNSIMAVFSVSMVFLHHFTKNYSLCSVLTVFVVFLIVFPMLFFGSDGYTGGMPSFFVFAIVFTVYLTKGKTMIALVILQYIVFVGISFYSYFFPESVIHYREEFDLLIDIVISFCSVSLILGLTMFFQFMMYTRQQKQLELARSEAERANIAKSAFLASMSHEIRTPIGIILGTNEMISRDSHSKDIKDHSGKVKSAGELLDALINNVLDFVKIEAGKTELYPGVYKVSTLLNELEQYGKILSRKKDLEFSLFTDKELSDYLVGDSLAIKQILLNLINNAVKYTEKGAVSLQVLQEKTKNNDEVLLRFIVSDTGIGIKQEEVDVIFDAFKRIDRNDGRYIEGVGLGLSIVKQLVSLMGGDIEVVSVYGIGSDFKVFLPQIVATSAQGSIKEDSPHTFVAPSVNMLIVDDNSDNLKLFSALLERTAMRIDTAQNAQKCFEYLESKIYDIILMDYMMPGMDGVELLAKIRNTTDVTAPVIAITANAELRTKEYLLQMGFDDYLTKPVKWETLEGAVMRHIPSQKYKIIELEKSMENEEAFSALFKLNDRLKELGVECETALHYANNNRDILNKAMSIYETNADKEITEALSMAENNDFNGLYFAVHSLKSRAITVGALRLNKESAELENLCKLGKYEEVTARLPYLLFLWEQSVKAARVILEKN